MIYKLSPIVLFVYNRLDHTHQTIESLQKNELAKESELFIYSDGAKTESIQKNVDEVRKYIKTVSGFKKVTIIEREKNWGLAKSIIDGVTKIVNEYGKIIVLEDDLVTSSNFLQFMNDALDYYENEAKVYSITGYSFSNDMEDIDSTYFLKLTSSWSWATWKDKWETFSYKNSIFDVCLNERYKFNYDDSYDYDGMIENQLKSKINSWAVYWYASVYLKNGLTLFPSKSLVENIGFDGSGTHCSKSLFNEKSYNANYNFTDDIFEKDKNRKMISTYLKNRNRLRLVLSKIKSILKRYL